MWDGELDADQAPSWTGPNIGIKVNRPTVAANTSNTTQTAALSGQTSAQVELGVAQVIRDAAIYAVNVNHL